MTTRVWLGSIFLKDEGGYTLVFDALKHYRDRLRTIASSPELKDSAAMFAAVLTQQANKTIPEIDETINTIKSCLTGVEPITNLVDKAPFLEKALRCYEADICKARDTGHEYFVNLVGDLADATALLPSIETAVKRIQEFELVPSR